MLIDSHPQVDISEIYDTIFNVVRADTAALLDRVYRLRHQVYCVENAFEDAKLHLDGRESDGDDDRSGHSLLIHRSSGAAAGTARVVRWLPDKPLPIQGLLSPEHQQAFEALPLEATGEISRFAVSRKFRQLQGELTGNVSLLIGDKCHERSLRPHITFGLMAGILAICHEYGITHVCAVMEPALIRLLNRIGLPFGAIGGLVEHHGLRQPCVARLVDMLDRSRSQDTLFWQYVGREAGQISRHDRQSPLHRVAA